MITKNEVKYALENEKYIKEFKIRSYIVAFFAVSVTVAAVFLPIPWFVAIPIAIVIGAISLFINGLTYNGKISKIMTEELNPLRYHHLIRTLNIEPSNKFDTVAIAIQIGDFDTAKEICNEKLVGTKSAFVKFLYLLSLAQCHFFLESYDELRSVCDEIDALAVNPAIKSQYKDTLLYYRSFSDSNFSACKQIKAAHEMSPDRKKSSRLNDFLIDYMYGIACYKNGDFDDATHIFEVIKKECENLYIGRMSDKLLTNETESASYRGIASCENVALPIIEADERHVLSGKRKLLLLLSLFILAVGIALLYYALTI